MKQVVNLSLEEAWQNNPVVQLECNDVWLSALIDSGAGMPMYFGNRKTLERRLNGRVLDARFDFYIMLSYSLFRNMIVTFDQLERTFSVDVRETPEMYVVHPYVVKENGQIYSLLNDVV